MSPQPLSDMSTDLPVYVWPKSIPTMKSGRSSPIDGIALLPMYEVVRWSSLRGIKGELCERAFLLVLSLDEEVPPYCSEMIRQANGEPRTGSQPQTDETAQHELSACPRPLVAQLRQLYQVCDLDAIV